MPSRIPVTEDQALQIAKIQHEIWKHWGFAELGEKEELIKLRSIALQTNGAWPEEMELINDKR